MSVTISLRLSLALGLLLGARTYAAGAPASEDTARAFYTWVQAHPQIALPDAKQRKILSTWLAPPLIEALQKAEAVEVDYARHTPKDEKPPMFEGDMFVDNYEGASEFALMEPEIKGDDARIEARFAYIDPRFPKGDAKRVVIWTDHLRLHHDAAKWMVVEVEYGKGTSLSGILADFIREHDQAAPAQTAPAQPTIPAPPQR